MKKIIFFNIIFVCAFLFLCNFEAKAGEIDIDYTEESLTSSDVLYGLDEEYTIQKYSNSLHSYNRNSSGWSFKQFGYSTGTYAGYVRDYASNHDDDITRIIPRKYFTMNCEYSYVGDEYGFYIKTIRNIDNNVARPNYVPYKSEVLVFDVDYFNSMKSGNLDVFTRISPLFSAQYQTINVGLGIKYNGIEAKSNNGYSNVVVPNVSGNISFLNITNLMFENNVRSPENEDEVFLVQTTYNFYDKPEIVLEDKFTNTNAWKGVIGFSFSLMDEVIPGGIFGFVGDCITEDKYTIKDYSYNATFELYSNLSEQEYYYGGPVKNVRGFVKNKNDENAVIISNGYENAEFISSYRTGVNTPDIYMKTIFSFDIINQSGQIVNTVKKTIEDNQGDYNINKIDASKNNYFKIELTSDKNTLIEYKATSRQKVTFSTSSLLDTTFIQINTSNNQTYLYYDDYYDEENDYYDSNASLSVVLNADEYISFYLTDYCDNEGVVHLYVTVYEY